MNPSYRMHWTAPLFLAAMRLHRKPYRTRAAGLRLWVLPGVLSPRYDWSGAFGVSCLPDLREKSFLEIGCGCGIVSVAAAKKGAKHVTAVDISPIAIQNTRLNLDEYGVANAEVILSDTFENITGAFDVIFFNAPFHGSTARDFLEQAVADPDYRTLRHFIAEASGHLVEGGRIVLGFSESGDLKLMLSLLDRAGLEVLESKTARRRGYSCSYYLLDRATKAE